MEELEKIKKKLKKDFEDKVELHPDSDFPIHEKHTKPSKKKWFKE